MVADTAVSGANEVAQVAVEGVENAAVASGFVKVVRNIQLVTNLKNVTF